MVGSSACGVFVAGRALAMRGQLQKFDVAIVIDTSASTAGPAEADINNNGTIGKVYGGAFGSVFGASLTDPGDSILSAAVTAARVLLRGLDPRSTRVAVITFAGEAEQQGVVILGAPSKPAITVQALTNDYEKVEHALDTVLQKGPAGLTHIAAGVDQATIELMGIKGALSRKDPTSEKIVLFLTDGVPTLPHGPQFEAENVRAVLRAAGRSQLSNIRIHSFAIGPEALTVHRHGRDGAAHGRLLHAGAASEMLAPMRSRRWTSRGHEVVLKNDTNGSSSPLPADRRQAGAASAREQREQARREASADDSTRAGARGWCAWIYAADGKIPEDLLVHRNRLLEECLRNLKQVRVAAEREAADKVRKDLMVEIEKEREQAKVRAAEQRKRLELGVEDEAPEPP